MITAPFMTDYFNKIRPEFLDTNGEYEMNSFALGALDAPEVMAAGSHYRYEAEKYSFVMPSSCSRSR